MTENTDDQETACVYAVRLTSAARYEIDQEKVRLTELSDLAIAQEWQNGVMTAIRGLATYPERCVTASENNLFQRVSPGDTLRLYLYRRTRTGPAWRILFSVHKADENDPPTVRIHHIRHASQAPMTEWPTENE